MAILRRSLLLAFLGLAAWASPLPASPAPPPGEAEYAVKAVFVYNFLRFIEWPRTAFSSSGDALVIGIIGDDPFGSLLLETVRGEVLRGRPVRVEHYRAARDIGPCHLLYVPRRETSRLDQIIAATAGRNVVTVGEADDFIARGGMIALTTDRNRVRLSLSQESLRAAGVEVSAKLLRVAEFRR